MFTSNRSLWRALHGLSHPFVLLAIVILLLNDHYLRLHYPSWLTGKLGDFAWLMFAPFFAALLFALVIPRRVRSHEKITGITAFITIGVWFALGKTFAPVHQLTTTVLDALVGWHGTLRMDATDLLTLPALLIGWCVWQRVPATPMNLRPIGYAAFGLGLLGTMANSPRERLVYTGVQCVIAQDDRLIIYAMGVFFSLDGGYTWQQEQASINVPDGCQEHSSEFELANPADPNIRYRFSPGQQITGSVDGGQTWTQEVDLSFTQQDAWGIYHQRNARLMEKPGASAAAFDAKTGNLVVAMGLDGILVRSPAGQWRWITVGMNSKADFQAVDLSLSLNREYTLALLLVMLISGTAFATGEISAIVLAVAWFAWMLDVLMQPAKVSFGYPSIFSFEAFNPMLDSLIASVVMGVIMWAIRNFRGTRHHVAQLVQVILLALVLYALPYVLWVNRTIPVHGTATFFAILLGGGTGLVSSIYLQQKLPEKQKRKNDDKVVPR